MRIKPFLAVSTLALALALAGCGGGDSTTTAAPRITEHETGGNYAGACLTCHGPGNGSDMYPPDHTGRANGECLTCHR